MATTNPFLFAHLEKVDLNKKTIKNIQKVYKASAMDIEKKLASLKMLHPSDNLKKLYFENLLKDINRSSDSFNRMIQSTITSAGEASGKIAVEAGVKYMESVGLSIKGAYSYIPRQEIMNIASGKVYGKHWSLSKAIWNADSKKKSDIQNIVAKGLAENKSIKSISDDLMKYVDPSARKPWDWSKVYPGTSAKVDYNAQRLARTMIQHSFQNSLVQSQKDNPFCKGIIWHSVFIEGRTCEICEARDGEVFDVSKLPLDHPNGLCYFEPELDKMDKVADRLADWVEGKPDPELDNYVAKAFGFGSPKVPLGKSVVDRTKEKTAQELARREKKEAAKKATAKKEAAKQRRIARREAKKTSNWMDNLKSMTEEKMIRREQAWLKILTDSEKKAIHYYTGQSGYKAINKFLRGIKDRGPVGLTAKKSGAKKKLGGSVGSERLKKTISELEKGLDKFILREDIYLRRGSSLADLAEILTSSRGGSYQENKEFLSRLFSRDIKDINKVLAKSEGSLKGYTSTSSLWNRGFYGNVEYIIKVPKGSHGASIMELSAYGRGEGEFLIKRGTKYRIVKVEKSDGHFGSEFRVFLEVIS